MAHEMLVPLPPQPADVPWPTPDPDGWPHGESSPELDKLVDDLVSDEDRYGTTYAVLVIHEGTPAPRTLRRRAPPLRSSTGTGHADDAIAVVVDGEVRPARRHRSSRGRRISISTRPHLCRRGTRSRRSPRRHHARASADDARRARLRGGLCRRRRVGRDRDAVRRRQGRCRGVRGGASAGIRAGDAFQLLVGNVEHRRRHRGSLCGKRRRVRRPASASGCSSRSA